MSTRTREKSIPSFRLNFKISFFQDVFTIIEELTGDCPGVDLPAGFQVKPENYVLFKTLQKRCNLTKLFITDFKKIRDLKDWLSIKQIIEQYRLYWVRYKNKLLKAKQKLSKDFMTDNFINKLQEISKSKWLAKELDVYLTLGYKHSGTYDRLANIIRLGIHEDREQYFAYTLYHELIHFHIVRHMNLQLGADEEEILCRSFFKKIFDSDEVAQKHWKENLAPDQIEIINKKII